MCLAAIGVPERMLARILKDGRDIEKEMTFSLSAMGKFWLRKYSIVTAVADFDEGVYEGSP